MPEAPDSSEPVGAGGEPDVPDAIADARSLEAGISSASSSIGLGWPTEGAAAVDFVSAVSRADGDAARLEEPERSPSCFELAEAFGVSGRVRSRGALDVFPARAFVPGGTPGAPADAPSRGALTPVPPVLGPPSSGTTGRWATRDFPSSISGDPPGVASATRGRTGRAGCAACPEEPSPSTDRRGGGGPGSLGCFCIRRKEVVVVRRLGRELNGRVTTAGPGRRAADDRRRRRYERWSSSRSSSRNSSSTSCGSRTVRAISARSACAKRRFTVTSRFAACAGLGRS